MQQHGLGWGAKGSALCAVLSVLPWPCVCWQLGETLQVLLLPLKGLSDALFKLKKEHSWQIDSRLATFALGLEFSHN